MHLIHSNVIREIEKKEWKEYARKINYESVRIWSRNSGLVLREKGRKEEAERVGDDDDDSLQE